MADVRSTAELIEYKRDGGTLSPTEIRTFLGGAVDGSIPDYQVSAMLMAVYFMGLADEELADFTLAMIESGDRLEIDTDRMLVDKHSTGGVGDKISIPLAPLVAACGVAVPMMSGRGLGHTGGTLDKLESIPGFQTGFTPREFADIVQQHGCIIAGQSDRIVPADRVLYALRDTTATVASIPLIASSIMSKKLAEGLDALVLDIKVGRGAFMKTDDDARQLARTMIRIGTAHGVEVRVFLTNMDQPLGNEVGNANEIAESIAVLRGEGPSDVTELVTAFGTAMLDATGVDDSNARIKGAVESGAALDKFAEMVEAQGGDTSVIDDPSTLPTTPHRVDVTAPQSGYVNAIDALAVGLTGVDLGAGRKTVGPALDLAAGVTIHTKVGSQVESGQPLATLFASDRTRVEGATMRIASAFTIADEPPSIAALVREEITA